ncbi:MAG: 4Fe-4S binding protein [Desulfovibrionaceae bacterium]
MTTTARLDIKDKNPVAALQDFMRRMLESGAVGGVLTPMHLGGGTPMPVLVTDPAELAQADPLAPAFPMNGAKTTARLTHGHMGERVAALLRPCEIRAFVELAKLNQGSLDGVLLVGLDCVGAYKNTDYIRFAAEDDPIQSTLGFLGRIGGAKETARSGYDLARACLACEYPTADVADVTIGVIGVDLHDAMPVIANTARGEALIAELGLSDWEPHEPRDAALRLAVDKRTAYRDGMFEETSARTSSIADLARYLSGCVNCYNCRVACPVCYCKECVFVTDVFDHKPWQYLGWAKQKGMLKMPTDTVFYHLTRLAHMSTACVGCGQCSNACPNDVPVMELFRTVAARTQEGFSYVPGRNMDEPPPLSVFAKDEFEEVVSHLA